MTKGVPDAETVAVFGFAGAPAEIDIAAGAETARQRFAPGEFQKRIDAAAGKIAAAGRKRDAGNKGEGGKIDFFIA